MKKNIVIVILSILVIVMGSYLVYEKFFFEDNKNNIIEEKKEEKKEEKIEEKKEEKIELITEEEANSFIKDLVGINYNLLLTNSELNDERIFSNSLKYLVFNDKYTKKKDLYIFNQSDFKDTAYIYYRNDDYNYVTKDSNFKYNSNDKTISSTLSFGLTQITPSNGKIKKTITEFNAIDNTASFVFNVDIKFPDYAKANSNTSYKITIEKVNDILRIKDVELVK